MKRVKYTLAKLLVTKMFILISVIYGQSQEIKSYHLGCIAFYNFENLFDTEDEVSINDEEFLPDGRYQWTESRYQEKLEHLSEVIIQIGAELIPDGPAILGVSEVENRRVLEDLVATSEMKPYNYQIVHYDSPDRRGVDVALLYQPKYFTLLNSKSYRLTIEGDTAFRSRDQLVVSGVYDTDTIYLIVNHWPSRRGGEKGSRPLRIAAARLCRTIVDSISEIYPNARIIVMGDLNDNPGDISVRNYLNTSGVIGKLKEDQLYNPMAELLNRGIGSTAYRDSWNLFDQIIISQPLLTEVPNKYSFHFAQIFNKSFLLQTEGAYKGYPFRTYGSGVYLGGYSDHFPVYIIIKKEVLR